MNRSCKIWIMFLLGAYGSLCAMHRRIAVRKLGSAVPSKFVVLDRNEGQRPGLRSPSPALLGYTNRLLCFSLADFLTDFEQVAGSISKTASPDVDLPDSAGFAALKQEADIRSSSADLMFETNISLDDVVEKVHAVADEHNGQSAAVVSKNGYASVVAKKDGHWVFLSLDRQSERKSFSPGSHMIVFDKQKDALDYLKKVCGLLATDPLDDDWSATIYSGRQETKLSEEGESS